MKEQYTGQQGLPRFPESFWRATTELPAFPRLAEDIEADVAVVGAGITGITAAYLLAKAGKDVVLLEAGRILNGTTGFTTAKVTAQHGMIYHEFMNHFGEEQARLYYDACSEAMDFIRRRTEDMGAECDLEQEDAYIYTQDDENMRSKLEDEFRAYKKLGIPGEWLESLPLPMPIKGAIKMPNQYRFHPLAYLKRMVEEFLKMGGRIYENTTIGGEAKTEGPITIKTRRGNHSITCQFAVSASHFPFHDGRAMYFARLHVERSYAVAIKPETDYPGGMYLSVDQPTRSLRSVSYNGEQLVLVGGENHPTGKSECTHQHYENLEKFGGELLGARAIPFRWSTQDLITLDKLPYIGPITSKQDRILVATGYRKWGMTNGTAAAIILTDQILEKENRYSGLYTPSRFNADPALKTFIVQNAGVAKDFIAGKFEMSHANIEDLKAGEGAVVRHNGQRAGAYKNEKGKLFLVDTTCSHMGCEVEWNEGERSWDCPCHGSRYAYDGKVLEGPAIEPLKKLDPDEG
ncbi:FAD-dependent oxidoreductase [Paenibacillus sp. DMB20]|uniref:FAD-dependent oxidoreductase n=1 Tax=Paenibacillus sp. DMB20 TaxID=1642570 RepID=UPI000627B400|nr:FAD-dependent oxidoreductase [Paenibacillus sp. DMB20]KKO54694.1 (2Fe-2S)-binding protein [Paenibacillus sp. DMB20]